MTDITLSEQTKAIILSISVVVAALGFTAIAGLIGDFDKDFSTIVTAISSLISVVTAYFKKVKDAVKNSK
jgi:chromate transport protein ChrA